MIGHILLGLGWALAISFLALLLIRSRKKPDGAIVVDTDDPEKDTYTLELYIPFGELDTKKDVVFRILHL